MARKKQTRYDNVKLQQAFDTLKQYALIRGRKRLTLDRLVEKCGVPRTTIVKILEIGRGDDADVDALAKALGFRRGRAEVELRNGAV